MKKAAFLSVLYVLPILLGGCIVVSSNKTHPPQKQECRTASPSSATIAEINAARALNTDSGRLEIYKAIAKRGNLTEQERIHLIEESKRNLHTDSARKAVLLILVNNQQQAVQPESELDIALDTAVTE